MSNPFNEWWSDMQAAQAAMDRHHKTIDASVDDPLAGVSEDVRNRRGLRDGLLGWEPRSLDLDYMRGYRKGTYDRNMKELS